MAARESQDPAINGEPVQPPEPVMRGTYALYATPDGGYHIAYVNTLGESPEETHHHAIPGMVVKLARQASEGGGPFGMLSRFMGGGE